MKIAIISPFQFRFARGIERVAWCLARALAQRGANVDILCWSWPNSVDWGETPSGVHVHRTPYTRYYVDRISIPFYVYWLMRGQYDWVLLFFAGYGESEAITILRGFRQLQNYGVIFQYPLSQSPHRYAEFAKYNLAKHASCLTTTTNYVAREVEQEFGKLCYVIGNGVAPEDFTPSDEARVNLRKELGLREQAPIMISVAALEERKGIQWVIRAIPHLIGDFPHLEYWVLGEGNFRQALELEIQKLNLEKHVKLLGSRNDVFRFLQTADIGCLLSHGEAFGIAVIECMASAIPIVASRHPPFDELVDPAWGVLVDETDTKQVAHELRDLLSDPGRCKRMGQKGREEVLRRHTWEMVAEQYMQLLISIQESE